MKITRKHLKRIIREEYSKLNESYDSIDNLEWEAMESDPIYALFNAYLENHLDAGKNRVMAFENAYKDMRNWVEKFIDQSKRDELDPEHVKRNHDTGDYL